MSIIDPIVVAEGSAANLPDADTGAGGRTGRRSSAAVARQGARDMTPMVFGVIPFALAIGAAVGASGLSTAQGIITGPGILAGAAQLSTITMLDAGSAPLVIVISALMINARILLYSASLAPWFTDQPLRNRLLLAIPVIDHLHLTCVPRFEEGDLDERERRAYYTGAAAFLASSWTVTQVVAIVGGASLPAWLGLHVAAPLALGGLLATSLKGRRANVAAVSAAAVTLVAAGLPFQSAVLVGIVVGLVIGTVAPVSEQGEEVTS